MRVAGAVSGKQFWTGWLLTGLVVAFSAVDGLMKVLQVPQVVDATVHRLDFQPGSVVTIGVLLLVCIAAYVTPRTAVLGAMLMTGYLGGAAAANVRAQNPAFETLFPVLFCVILWLGLFLREDRLRQLVPLRR